MSDFDKEAEREKLRERFEDEADDAVTERMSELLLQGATMTNTHCDRCGSPMFRHNGRSFCPHCAHEDTNTAADQQAAAAATTESTPSQAETDPEPDTQPTVTPTQSAGDAAGALQAVIERHATAAAEAEDPRRASDHIAVAREAAETLAVLAE